MLSYPPQLTRDQVRRDCLLRAEIGDQIECHMRGFNLSDYNPDGVKCFTVIATRKDKFPIIGVAEHRPDCFWSIGNNRGTFAYHRVIDNFSDYLFGFRVTSVNYVTRIIKSKTKFLTKFL